MLSALASLSERDREALTLIAWDDLTRAQACVSAAKAALIALRQILGPQRFDASLRAIQRRYAGSTITECQAEAAFTARLPDPSPACRLRLSQFFTQWFDTGYHGSKPQITGPGLRGRPFYAHGCTAPGRG